MSDIAIQVENLGKAYCIGLADERHDTLAGLVASWAKAPLRNLRRLRRLNTFQRTAKSEEQRAQSEEHRAKSGESPSSSLSALPSLPLSALSSSLSAPSDIIWALRDVSFQVRQGEVVGVIGRNGAGKSTLLKILSRITDPTTGRAVIEGRVSSLLEVGTGFHPELTGRENVYMNGTILGMTRREIDRKFDEIVDFSGVEKFLDTPVKRYSSGMKVRLAFAVAAHLEPEILIVDEVLAVGDAEFQKKCLGKMGDVAKSGRTVLFVSHNMAAVESLCGTGIVLTDGRITANGSIRDAIDSYMAPSDEGAYDIDLATHPNRLRGFRELFQRLRILDDLGNTVSRIGFGRCLTIEVSLSSVEPLAALGIGIHIYSSNGQRVATCHSAYQSTARPNLKSRLVVRCCMSRCQLMPGRYSLVVGLAASGRLVDRIDPVGFIDVEPRDFYETGRLPPPRDGVFAPFAEWSFGE